MSTVARQKPDFLYLGAPKSASTWIYCSLAAHPQIFVPPAKGINFFDRHYDRGLEWYDSFFTGASPQQTCVGELSHFYLYSRQAAERIHDALPSVKTIACVRNPIRRAWSAYLFKKRNGLTSADFEPALRDDPRMLENGLYAEHIACYQQLMGKERFKVCIYDDLERDAEAFGRSLYSFLGVDESFENPHATNRVLKASRPRSAGVAAIVRGTARIVRNLGFPNIVGRIKGSTLLPRLLYVSLDKKHQEGMLLEQWDQLADYFREDVTRLSSLLDRDLTHWLKRPTPGQGGKNVQA